MRPSRILRNLFLRSSLIVVPLPIPTLFNQKICQELESLKSRGGEKNSNSSWLLLALESSISIQKIAQECLANVDCKDSDGDSIDGYLQDSIELLDACNNMLEKMDVLFNYRESLQVVLHILEGRSFQSNLIGLSRAKEALDVCLRLEKQCREMSKCNSRLKRMNDKLAQRAKSCFEPELDEILNGSLSIVSLVCEVVNAAFSFKSKCRVSVMHKYSSFLDDLLQKLMKEETHDDDQKQKKGSILLRELRRTVNASQVLREQIKSQNYGEICETVEELKRSCDEFGEVIKPFEGKVKELYRELISFRVALLGTLSSL